MAKVIMTGASSFTGFWFAKALSGIGHEVYLVFCKGLEEYRVFPRAERVRELASSFSCRFLCQFGSPAFFDLLTSEDFDLLAMHGAVVGDYKAAEFPVLGAVSSNVNELDRVLDRFGGPVVVTGSYFEAREGGDSANLPVSPYGLSKSLTTDIVEFACSQRRLPCGHFVIPNPFGPFEEYRYTSHLASTWLRRGVPVLQFPKYLRDNIHASILADEYARFVSEMRGAAPGSYRSAPSQYVETQLEFTERFAREMRPRLEVPCEYAVREAGEYGEPMRRFNAGRVPSSDDSGLWSRLAEYYRTHADRISAGE